jgi:MFS transporter, ACDE family, multidrug resistance protein
MRRIHMPIWLVGAPKPRAGTFVLLFTFEALNRALLMTLIPLQALAIFGTAQKVSIFYLSVSAVGLIASLVIPSLVHVFRRRWVFSAGFVIYIMACFLFTQHQTWALVLGLMLQVSATACIEITINLYLLDHIPRRELKRFEPKRLLFAGVSFTAGPWLGVYLAENVGRDITYMLVAGLAVAALGVFWYLRLTDDPALAQPLKPTPNPIRYLPRFFSQKRLLLAWGLAIGRNGWWLMFFVYTPIFMAENGFSPEWSGAAVSLGVLPMLAVTYWGKVAERHGIRFVMFLGYGLAGILSLVAATMMGLPAIGVTLLVLAAGAATIIDAAGNVPFLRAVHPYERSEMTSVFMTFRHVTNLATPAIFAVLLTTFPLTSVFVTGGVAFLGMATLSRFIHRRL